MRGDGDETKPKFQVCMQHNMWDLMRDTIVYAVVVHTYDCFFHALRVLHACCIGR